MAIGRSYPYDNKIEDTDLFLGTKSSNLTTVNYTAQAVADYLNTQGKISIGGQMVFKFVTVNPLAGTISFPTLGGNNTPFSAITNLIVSVADLSTQNVVNFISYIVGSEILLTQQNQISTFGNYKITAYAITANPNFYDLTVEYIGGYGSIVENTYYDLSFFREPASAPAITPNLNDVLLEGNTSLLDAKIGSLYLYDTTAADYARVDITNDIFTVNLASNNPLFQNGIGVSRVWNSIGVEGVIDYSLLTGGRIYSAPDASGTIALLSDIPTQGLTSVGLSMPAAFNVANSPLTSDGTIAVSAAGTSSQYIRGDGQLATLPSGGGGGSSVNYYLNGSISASVAGYKQLSNTAIIGGGTDFPLTGNGLIAEFLTDAGNPNRIEIPGGAWNFEMWFSMSSNGGTPKFYVELLKYNGTTFTTIANSSAAPETIDGGTVIDLYLTSLAVPTTTLLSTDRLAVRVYIVDNSGGRTATLHTEDTHLCEILTTFSGGITSLNGLTANTQYLAIGTTGTDFNISSLTDTHTFNLPTASATNRGALSSTDFTSFNNKFNLPALTSGSVLFSDGTTIAQKNSNFFWDNTNNRLGIGTNTPVAKFQTITDNFTVAQTYGSYNNAFNQIAGSTNQGLLGSYSSTLGSYIASVVPGSGWKNMTYIAFDHIFQIAGVTAMTIKNTTNNVLINTTTDNGGKLQIKAAGALSTDIALRVRNSADTFDIIRANGAGDVFLGLGAGNVSTGTQNVFIGLQSGLVNTTASYNTAVGGETLKATTGGYNTAIGRASLKTNSTGTLNTAMGVSSLEGNLGGNNNVALGVASMQNNTSGSNNIAIGVQSPIPTEQNTTGSNNIFLGFNAVGVSKTESNRTWIGNSNTTSTWLAGNTLIGTTTDNGGRLQVKAPGALSTDIALRVRNSADTFDIIRANGRGDVFLGQSAGNSVTGINNIFFGNDSGKANTTATGNTGLGFSSLLNNIGGIDNTAIGSSAGAYTSTFANVTNSSYSVFIGSSSKPLGDSQTNQIVIGQNANGAGSNTATLGNTSIVDTVLRGRVNIQQYATASRPTYVKGALIYDSSLSKLVIGGATGWEVVTSI